MKKNVLDIARKLISTPSYLGEDTDEVRVAEFVMDFLKEYPSIKKIDRQMVEGRRFNVIAQTTGKPKLLIACHLDTVFPINGGKYDPLSPRVVKDRLYGLGAKDMKGGLACVLAAVSSLTSIKNLALLFYVDEESDLKGIKRFVLDLKYKPQLVVSPESSFEIANGRRGIITIDAVVRGRSAHTARPHLGINAVESFHGLYQDLKKRILRFRNQNLGQASCVLTFVHGGSFSSKSQTVEMKPNIVPDYLRAVINIRTPLKELNATFVSRLIRKLAKEKNLKVTETKTVHDYAPSFVNKSRLVILERSIRDAGVKPKYSKNIKNSGYNDVALIREKTGADFVNFGPYGEANHSPDEWVSINSLQTTTKIFEKLITNMHKK